MNRSLDTEYPVEEAVAREAAMLRVAYRALDAALGCDGFVEEASAAEASARLVETRARELGAALHGVVAKSERG